AAAAAMINFWLGLRIAQIRTKEGISIGDGGNELLTRRMRAQLNFAENTPLVLILIALVELAGRGGLWLNVVAALFLVGRVLHAIGMDGASLGWGRSVGMAANMLTFAILVVTALLIVARVV
ncbi:MAG: MAPEG family protein, partial [Croceibacterium sp.]